MKTTSQVHQTVSPSIHITHTNHQRIALDENLEEEHQSKEENKVEVNGMSDGDADSENESSQEDAERVEGDERVEVKREEDQEGADATHGQCDAGEEEVLPPRWIYSSTTQS